MACLNGAQDETKKMNLLPLPRKLTADVSCVADGLPQCKQTRSSGRDRNLSWRAKDYRYAPSRVKEDPEYIGSYAMDAISMAFHCVWNTTSFKEALLKSANMGGDADTVSAITGQIAGAIYGVGAIPKNWVMAVQQWDRSGEIALKAMLLYRQGGGGSGGSGDGSGGGDRGGSDSG